MAELTRRLQLLLEPGQMENLQSIAQQTGRSVAELIRDAIDRAYSPRSDLAARQVLERMKTRAWIQTD